MERSSAEDGEDDVLNTVRACGDRAAQIGRDLSPLMVRKAEQLYAAHTTAMTRPELFARGRRKQQDEMRDLAERSIRAELACAMGVSESVAWREIAHARLLMEDLPRTRAALTAGEVLWAAGQAICAEASTLPQACRAALDERAVALATALTPGQLRRALKRVREEVHNEPFDERFERATTGRTVWLTAEADGMATLSATLPAAIAVGAYNRLDRIARTLSQEDGERRSLAQLRADAAADILCDGDVVGTAPLDDETTPAATFVPGVRAAVHIVVPVLTAAGTDDEGAELSGYGPIPAPVARELVGTGSAFFRVLADPVTCQVVSVGRIWRTPPPQMRTFLELRDQNCRFPGCHRPAATAEADHTREWAEGGETAITNLLFLCTGHHHLRHAERWTYTLHPDGTAEWTSPTGRHRTTRPAPLFGAVPRRDFTERLAGGAGEPDSVVLLGEPDEATRS